VLNVSKSIEIMNSLVVAMEEHSDDASLQEALDGVRDFVGALLISEGVEQESFYQAIRDRIPEIKRIANVADNKEEN